MLDPTPVADPRQTLQNPASPRLVPGKGAARPDETVLSEVDLHSRRLRYFLDLLEEGYHQALRPDPLSRSMRVERIALGIDLPELDTVPLWSVRREDGAVSIPFIEFILWQAGETLHALCGAAEEEAAAGAQELRESHRALTEALDGIRPTGQGSPSIPRHRDIFVAESTLRDLCGPSGLLGRIARQCDALSALKPRGLDH